MNHFKQTRNHITKKMKKKATFCCHSMTIALCSKGVSKPINDFSLLRRKKTYIKLIILQGKLQRIGLLSDGFVL